MDISTLYEEKNIQTNLLVKSQTQTVGTRVRHGNIPQNEYHNKIRNDDMEITCLNYVNFTEQRKTI